MPKTFKKKPVPIGTPIQASSNESSGPTPSLHDYSILEDTSYENIKIHTTILKAVDVKQNKCSFRKRERSASHLLGEFDKSEPYTDINAFANKNGISQKRKYVKKDNEPNDWTTFSFPGDLDL